MKNIGKNVISGLTLIIFMGTFQCFSGKYDDSIKMKKTEIAKIQDKIDSIKAYYNATTASQNEQSIKTLQSRKEKLEKDIKELENKK